MDRIEEQVIEYMNAKFKWSKDLPLRDRAEVMELYMRTMGGYTDYRDWIMQNIIECRDVYELDGACEKSRLENWLNEKIEQCAYLSDVYDYMAHQNRNFWVEMLDAIADEYETVDNVVNEMTDNWLDFKDGTMYVMDECNKVVFLYNLNDLWDKHVSEADTGELLGLDYYGRVSLV